MEEQIYEQMMEMYSEIFKYYPILSIVGILATAFGLLFMHFSAQHRNHKLGMGWYVCGILFNFWTVLVFLLKRKNFPGPDLKVCPSCGNRCPLSYEVCNRCLVELPEVNTEEKAKQKKLSKIFGIGFVVTWLASAIAGIVMVTTMTQSVFDLIGDYDYVGDYSESYRIAVDGVYYDKKGNGYENEADVPVYDKEGRIYTYQEQTETDEDGYEYVEFYYVRDDGERYYESDCYVTADGWFYCDMAGVLEYYYPDTENMTPEELEAYYKDQMENSRKAYRYYDYYLYDKDGNIYYCIYEASWNEKGELITAENDPTLTEEKPTAVTE